MRYMSESNETGKNMIIYKSLRPKPLFLQVRVVYLKKDVVTCITTCMEKTHTSMLNGFVVRH